MSPTPRKCMVFAGGLAMAAVFGVPATAQDDASAPALGERVALALSSAQTAQTKSDSAALAQALAVIERSGARPLGDWKGEDPVPAWRALVPETQSPLRGSPLGPGYRSGKASPGGSDSFEQVFLSGKKASIALSTPSDTPLTLQVLDADRRPVCTTADARRACRWVPLFTQRYVIEVRNGGNRVAEYFLVVE